MRSSKLPKDLKANGFNAITFTSDAPRLTFVYPNDDYPSGQRSDLKPGKQEILAFGGVRNLSEYVFAEASGGYFYSDKYPVTGRDFYFPVRTDISLCAQMQYWDGGTCRCVVPQVMVRDDGLWLTNAAAWSVKWDAT